MLPHDIFCFLLIGLLILFCRTQPASATDKRILAELNNHLYEFPSFTYSIIINDNLNLLKDNRIISLIICAFISLVPSKLVELRYFTPVYIIFNILINYNKDNFGDLHQYIFNWFNIIVQFVINCITIYA